LLGVVAIYQGHQRVPERFDLVCRRAHFGKVYAGGGGDTIGIVAGTATGAFEDGIKAVLEGRGLRGESDGGEAG